MKKTKKNTITVREKSMRIGIFSHARKKPTVKYSISVDTKIIANERLTHRHSCQDKSRPLGMGVRP